MATVYKAFDTRLEREVALKVVRRKAFPEDKLDRILKRFEREAKALAKLSHANIIPIIDSGEEEGTAYLVMGYIPGGTLKERLKKKPIPWQEAAQFLAPIARALDYAHKQGIVHRDIKPSNILITKDNQPMLTDFGIARILKSEETLDLTGTGMGVGTPEYMAPEQGLGKKVDHRADIYALGIVFYEMVTGRKPFQADTPMAVVVKQINDPLPRPTKFVAELPNVIEGVLLKALAKDPANRYKHMAEFSAALENPKIKQKQRIKTTPPKRKTRALLLGGITTILLSLGAIWVGITKPFSPEIEAPSPTSNYTETTVPIISSSTPEIIFTKIPISTSTPIIATTLIRFTSNGNNCEPPTVPVGKIIVEWGQTEYASIEEGENHFGNSKPEFLFNGLRAPLLNEGVWDNIQGREKPWAIRFSAEMELIDGEYDVVVTWDAEQFSKNASCTITVIDEQSNSLNSGLDIDSSIIREKDGMAMMYVPAGEFKMGSNDGDTDFQPVHDVYLDAFWIDQTEVTNAMFAECVPTGQCRQPSGNNYKESGYANHPVVYVSWRDANLYCGWAGVRLPTEAEWEKAARGGLEGLKYPWGDESPSCNKGAENGAQYSNCDGQTVTVGSFAPNGYGLYDMAGNVWEWVADWYSRSYYSNSPNRNPMGPSSGEYHVLRGGSWSLKGGNLCSACRIRPLETANSSSTDGFRCARDAILQE